MVTLYVAGKPVGSWREAEQLFAETARTQTIEFRDNNGCVIAISTPGAEEEPDWVKAITPEETARRLKEDFLTLDEFKARLGQWH